MKNTLKKTTQRIPQVGSVTRISQNMTETISNIILGKIKKNIWHSKINHIQKLGNTYKHTYKRESQDKLNITSDVIGIRHRRIYTQTRKLKQKTNLCHSFYTQKNINIY